jgi:hypothetical protein
LVALLFKPNKKMNFKEKYRILDTDSEEVKKGKQTLLDLYDAALLQAKEQGFDPESEAGKAKIEAIFAEKAKPLSVKIGEKEMGLTEWAKSVQDAIDQMSVKLQQSKTSNQPRTFRKALTEAIQEKEAEIKQYLKEGGKPIVFDVKDVVTIGVGNTINSIGSDSQTTISVDTGIIAPIRKPLMTYLTNVSTGTIGNQYAIWIEEVDEEGNPVFIAEAGTKTQISVQYVEQREQVKKIGVTGKVTYELMQDLPQLVSYIQSNMMRRVEIATENQLFNGDGLTVNLKGMAGYSTAFTGGSLAGKVDAPNNIDVLRAAILQSVEAFGSPTAFFVDEGELARMELTKDQDFGYVYPTFFAASGRQISGVRLIGTTQLPSGITFMGGDLSVVNVRFREGMTVQIGESGEDFRDNLKTIKVEQRLVQFVSANDTQVLVKGDFTTAKALLDSTPGPS